MDTPARFRANSTTSHATNTICQARTATHIHTIARTRTITKTTVKMISKHPMPIFEPLYRLLLLITHARQKFLNYTTHPTRHHGIHRDYCSSRSSNITLIDLDQ